MNARRAALVSLLALALIVIAGCGGGGDSSSSSSSTGEVKGGPLTLWLGGILAQATPGSDYRKWYDDQIAEFEKAYPGTEVKTVLLNPDGVKQNAQFRAAFGAGEGPDLEMMYPGGFTTDFASSLVNLRDAAPDVLDQFADQSLQYGCENFDCSGDAPEYLAPYDVSGWILAYNKEIFDKVGIEAPFQSWDEMVAAGEKLKAAGYTPFQMGNRDGYISDAYLSNMESSYLAPEDIGAVLTGDLQLTDEKFTAPLQKWADLYSQGLANENACSLETLASQRDFFSGKAATVASYDYANLYKQMGDKLGVMTWPPIDDAPNAANSGPASQVGQGWTIPADTSNLPLAKALLEQLTSADAQTKQFEIAGSPPANVDASTDNAPDPATGESAKLFQDATILSFDSALPLETQTAYFKDTNLALCGNNTPEEAMQSIQDVLDRETR
jgi:raffinose/stachyose/melibiose transport system substrate-binding protein